LNRAPGEDDPADDEREVRYSPEQGDRDMVDTIDSLVTSYDVGILTRRQLLQALAAVAAPSSTSAQRAEIGVMKSRILHHVNVQVSDVRRSEAFYRTLFRLPPTRRVQGPDNHGLDLPGGGLIILQKSDRPGRIDHFCVGVEDFDAERMRTAAKAAGMEGIQGNAADNFFVTDPDGLRVQVSAVDWSA
jgi:catechol 2,3-dioxygenase-like lactoylglutathione lyase family enzyme